jgi:hypothetical protein
VQRSDQSFYKSHEWKTNNTRWARLPFPLYSKTARNSAPVPISSYIIDQAAGENLPDRDWQLSPLQTAWNMAAARSRAIVLLMKWRWIGEQWESKCRCEGPCSVSSLRKRNSASVDKRSRGGRSNTDWLLDSKVRVTVRHTLNRVTVNIKITGMTVIRQHITDNLKQICRWWSWSRSCRWGWDYLYKLQPQTGLLSIPQVIYENWEPWRNRELLTRPQELSGNPTSRDIR